MDPPNIRVSSRDKLSSQSVGLASPMSSPLEAPTRTSSSSSSSSSLTITSVKLGDFSRLHHSIRNCIPASTFSDSTPTFTSTPGSPSTTTPSDTVKLGNFSKLIPHLSRDSSQKPAVASDKMSYPFYYNGGADTAAMNMQLADQIYNMSCINNALLQAQYGQTSNAYMAQQPTMAHSISSAPCSQPNQYSPYPASGTDSDSDVPPDHSPISTPPSSVDKDVSPIAAVLSGKVKTHANALLGPHSPVQHLLSYQLYRGGAFIPVNVSKRTKADKHESLSLGLVNLHATDSLVAKEHPNVVNNGVHVFLDMSNISISFQKSIKVLHKIPDDARFTPIPNLNLEFLTELLLRGREAKVLNVGCSVHPSRSPPSFVQELRDLDYHVDLRERKALPEGRKARYAEDLVDETLQTRMGESVMEYFDRRGTLVIATGDAKPAKYSDGFFAYAERALKMGWNVEVVSWKASLSSTWVDPSWTEQWGSRFRVIELDGFLDDLLAIYA